MTTRSAAERALEEVLVFGMMRTRLSPVRMLDDILANPAHRAALLAVLLDVDSLTAALLQTAWWRHGTSDDDEWTCGELAAAILAHLTDPKAPR